MFRKMLFCAVFALASVAQAQNVSEAEKTVFRADAAILADGSNLHLHARWLVSRDFGDRFGAGAFFNLYNKTPSVYVGPSVCLHHSVHAGFGFQLSKEENPLTNLGIWLEVRQEGEYPLDVFALLDDDGLDLDVAIDVHSSVGAGITIRDFESIGPRVEWNIAPMICLWGSPLYNWVDRSAGGVIAFKISL